MKTLYDVSMLYPVDIAVLLKLSLPGAPKLSFQKLAQDMCLSSSEVFASVKRATHSGLITENSRSRIVKPMALLEFLQYGMQYSFPAERGQPTRGIPTAYAAEPLKSVLEGGDELPPVWPCPEGKVRGFAFTPIYKHAAAAALKDQKFYELLALVDGLRDGRVRDRKIALEELSGRFTNDVTQSISA
jgi:hypothetical protein